VDEIHPLGDWFSARDADQVRSGLFFFRTQAGQEVDVVLESCSGQLVGIELQAGAMLKSEDAKGLRVLAEATGARFHRGVILCQGREMIPLGTTLHAVPVEAMWSGRA
jgi:predicted AAA+ superfamily ATPase